MDTAYRFETILLRVSSLRLSARESRISIFVLNKVRIHLKTEDIFERWVGAARVWTGGLEYKETSINEIIM
jgi:hypothetical protein